MIAVALVRRLIRCRQEHIHFLFFQVGNERAGGFLDGDVLQFAAPLDMFRAVQTDETRQRVYSGESLVSRRHTAFSFFFQFEQERAYSFTRQVDDFQAVNGFAGLSRRIGQKHPKGVTVAFLRVGSKIAFADQIFHQESTNPGAQQIGISHGRPPSWRIVQSDC